MVKRFIMVTLALLTIGVQAFAQNVITGKVVDSKGEPVPAAGVQVKGTNNGVVSDLDGNFSIKAGSGDVLVVTSIGYKTTNVAVGNQTKLNIVVEDDALLLDDVVVVAYGTARKKDLTGSISTVDNKTLADQAQGSITRMLEGQVAGLQTASLDGQPGMDMGIRIRGIGTKTANNSNALIIIDGAPALEGTQVLSSLNSKDIESITVLKDAASTALYGSRGANGVVLVTTKSGKAGKTKVSFEARMGINAIGANAKFDKIGDGGVSELYETQWLAIYNAVYYGYASGDDKAAYVGNDTASRQFASAHLFNYTGSTSKFTGTNGLMNQLPYTLSGMNVTSTGSLGDDGQITASTKSGTLSGAFLVNTDGKINPQAKLLYSGSTLDEELITNRFRQEYVVSASGGSDKVDYHLSLSYLDDPSYITWSSFDRYTARANVNAQITDWLKAGAKFSYTNRKTNSQATRWGRNPGYVTQNVFTWVNLATSLNQLYARNADGSFVKDGDGNRVILKRYGAATVNATTQENALGYVGTQTAYNLPLLFSQAHDTQAYSDMVMNGYLRASFLKYFTAEANITHNVTSGLRTRFYNSESASGFVGASMGSAIWKSQEKYSTVTLQQLVNFNRDIDKHHVDALVGHEYYQYDYDLIRTGGAHSLISDFEGYVNFLGTQTYNTFGSTVGGNINKMAMESYFGRANYVYDDKYYASVSLRRDGSSKFKLPENRWGTFWSIGAGWRISSEEFMADTKTWLDNLKLRADYGVIGNQNGIGMYSGYQTWGYSASAWAGSGNSTYPSATTLSKSGWVNDGLTWEKVGTTDVGLDFTVLGGKIAGSFDWYNRHTTNALWDQNTSFLAAGQASLMMNTAGIRNRGIELELNYQPVKTTDWDVILSTNGTHYKTVLTSIPAGTGSDALDGNYTASDDAWSLAGGGGSSQGEFLRGVGKDYYNLYVYKYGGVAGNTGKTYYASDGKSYTGSAASPDLGLPLFWHKVTEADVKAGKYGSAAQGDDILTTIPGDASQYEVGSATPKWIGGFSANVRYKNFDLAVNTAYQLGGKFFSVQYGSGENGMYMGSVNTTDGVAVSRELLGNTWTADNPDAKFPMLVYGNSAIKNGTTTTGSWHYTDMALFDASYFSIKNITLGYTLPKKLVQKVNISNLRVYASCDNPVLLYSHSGVDPRWSITGGFGVGAYAYPYLSVYTFGINLDF